MKVADILTIMGAISPILLLVLGALFKRKLDKATEVKTHAEADVQQATALKVDAERESVVLANAKLLIAEARAVQAEKDAIKDERITQLNTRVGRMEDRFNRMRAALATHGVWDATALVDLRSMKPEYPEPPHVPTDALGEE